MARSQWKGLGLEKSYLDNGKNIWCRSRRIIMNDVGQIYKVYNGRKFVEDLVNELMVGHDRFICDIRSLVHARLLGGRDVPLCVRPYDLCTELIAREAGCVVVHPDGSPLTDPLDTKTNMSWVGHANCHLCARVQPLFEEILRHHRLI